MTSFLPFFIFYMEKTILSFRMEQGYAVTVGLRLDGCYVVRVIVDFPNTSGGFANSTFKDSREAEYLCSAEIDDPISAVRKALSVIQPF